MATFKCRGAAHTTPQGYRSSCCWAQTLLLKVMGHKQLLESNDDVMLLQKIQLRAPYVTPLNVLQVQTACTPACGMTSHAAGVSARDNSCLNLKVSYEWVSCVVSLSLQSCELLLTCSGALWESAWPTEQTLRRCTA